MLPWQKCTENSPSARFLTIRARDAELDTFIQAILRQKQKTERDFWNKNPTKSNYLLRMWDFFCTFAPESLKSIMNVEVIRAFCLSLGKDVEEKLQRK